MNFIHWFICQVLAIDSPVEVEGVGSGGGRAFSDRQLKVELDLVTKASHVKLSRSVCPPSISKCSQ